MLRPREGHDLHIAASRVEIEPAADVRWLRDIYGNSIAVFIFHEPSRKSRLLREVDRDGFDETSIRCLFDTACRYR